MKGFAVQDLLLLYRHIFCACKCGHVFRLSDAQVVDRRKATPRDWLSTLAFKVDGLTRRRDKAEEAFAGKQEGIRERERRRAQRLCDLAVAEVIPRFKQMALNTADVKAILFPVRFIVFDGLAEKSPRRIRLLDNAASDKAHRKLQDSLIDTIERKEVRWSTVHVGDTGEISRKD